MVLADWLYYHQSRYYSSLQSQASHWSFWIWLDLDESGWIWIELSGSGWICMDLNCSDGIWRDLESLGRSDGIWMDPSGSGWLSMDLFWSQWIWVDLIGSGWIWLDLRSLGALNRSKWNCVSAQLRLWGRKFYHGAAFFIPGVAKVWNCLQEYVSGTRSDK